MTTAWGFEWERQARDYETLGLSGADARLAANLDRWIDGNRRRRRTPAPPLLFLADRRHPASLRMTA